MKGCPEPSCTAGTGQGQPRVNPKRPGAPLNATFSSRWSPRWLSARSPYNGRGKNVPDEARERLRS